MEKKNKNRLSFRFFKNQWGIIEIHIKAKGEIEKILNTINNLLKIYGIQK